MGPECLGTSDDITTAIVRACANRATIAAGVALRLHVVIDEHCPGANGNGHPSWPRVASGVTGVPDSPALATVLSCELVACIIPMFMPWAELAAPAGAGCIPHSVPLPSSMSCKRNAPQSAATERRANDMSVGYSNAQVKARPALLLVQSGYVRCFRRLFPYYFRQEKRRRLSTGAVLVSQ